jgi:hypothetical protein
MKKVIINSGKTYTVAEANAPQNGAVTIAKGLTPSTKFDSDNNAEEAEKKPQGPVFINGNPGNAISAPKPEEQPQAENSGMEENGAQAVAENSS